MSGRLKTFFLVIVLSVAIAGSASGQPSIPHLKKNGTATQLVVNGKPFLIRGGELGNSTASKSRPMLEVRGAFKPLAIWR